MNIGYIGQSFALHKPTLFPAIEATSDFLRRKHEKYSLAQFNVHLSSSLPVTDEIATPITRSISLHVIVLALIYLLL